MNSSRILRTCLVCFVVLCSALSSNAQVIVTNWAAYNDHFDIRTPSPVRLPTGQWGTHPRATIYPMGAPADTVGAVLTNFYTGEGLPVTMTVIRTGSPDNFGEAYAPATNTPAHSLFFGICDLDTDGIVGVDAAVPGGADATVDYLTFTFNGLNPDKRYLFRGTSMRVGGYVPRWSVATLTNVNGFIDAHINGSGSDPNSRVLTANDFPAEIRPGQAAWNSGDNVEGAVVGWDFIAPLPDGSFSIIVEQYTNRISATAFANAVQYGYSFGAILLAEVEASPPVITTNPPPQTTLEHNRPFSLSVSAEGTPLLYQWYKEGPGGYLAVPGATFRTYSVSQAAVADSGNYVVRVYNPLASVTSTVARVTVTPDVTPPSVFAAFSFPSLDPSTQAATLDQVIVEFNETIQDTSVSNPSQYTISGGIGNPTSVSFTNGRSVILTLSSALAEDTDYTVQVTGGTDLAGNTAGTTTMPFHSWSRGPGNTLLYEFYNTGAGVTVAILTNHPSFPDSPSFRSNLWALDTRIVLPDNTQGGYGSRISGVFIPPFSGDWVFFLRAWDRGAVFLNPNGTDPAGRQLVLQEVTGGDPRDWNKFTSAPFALQGGRGYYIEALQKAEAGGAVDAIKVAARPADTGFPTLGVLESDFDTNSLMGGYIASPLAPRDLGGTLTIAQQPVNTTIEAGHPVTFSVQLNNPSRLPILYQWSRDGAEITGATGPSYTFSATNVDNGSTFSVRAAKVGSAVTSSTVTLTVVPDTTAPRAIEANSPATNLFQIAVVFDELVIVEDGEDEFNYRLVEIDSAPVLATMEPDGKTVILTFLSPLNAGATYSVEVANVRDLAENPMIATTLTFTGGTGGLVGLQIVRYENEVTISWPAPSTGYVLEETSALGNPATWTTVTTTPTVVNGRNTVTASAASGSKLYRLKQ